MHKTLQEILAPYDVELITSQKSIGKDVFTDIIDRRNEYLHVTVQHHEGAIYCVYFLNNQYFEQEAETLYGVLKSLLAGSYSVRKRGVFKRKQYIEIHTAGTKTIGPQRTTNDEDFKASYRELPMAFGKKLKVDK